MKIMYNEDEGSVVDFYPSHDTGVVIVSEADQVAGNAYKRKLAKLRKTQPVQGIVIAERTKTSAQYFSGLQDFTVLELGLKVIPVESMVEAANLIIQIAHVEHKSTGSSPNPFRIKRKGPTIDSSLLATVQLIPGLGAVKAKLLLGKFKSLKEIVAASEKDLSECVGKSTAVSVRSFLLKVPASKR
ncbi:Fanconi anemia core complex-associated protein 24-like isoform X2 [Lineus longissimus]